MRRPLLTPGLTPLQRQQVADVLQRVGIVPPGRLGSLFLDVDVAASRVLNATRPSREDCRVIAGDLAEGHDVDALTISFAYGLAVGIRQGRTFAPTPPRRAKNWISEEYRQLHEHNRRAAAKFIRQLLKIQGAPRLTAGAAKAPRPGKVETELEAAKRWIRTAGKAARREGYEDE